MRSEAQRRFLHARHPVIAARFEAETPKGKALPQYVSGPSVDQSLAASLREQRESRRKAHRAKEPKRRAS